MGHLRRWLRDPARRRRDVDRVDPLRLEDIGCVVLVLVVAAGVVGSLLLILVNGPPA